MVVISAIACVCNVVWAWLPWRTGATPMKLGLRFDVGGVLDQSIVLLSVIAV